MRPPFRKGLIFLTAGAFASGSAAQLLPMAPVLPSIVSPRLREPAAPAIPVARPDFIPKAGDLGVRGSALPAIHQPQLASGAQLLPAAVLQVPSVQLPVPGGPVLGPVLDDILASPQSRQVINPTLDSVSGLSRDVAQAGESTLLQMRRLRLQELVRQHRAELEAVENGLPVRRGVLLAIDPDAASLQRAAGAGFRRIGEETDADLGIRSVYLAVPSGMSVREAIARLRRAAPGIVAEYDHVFEPAGGALLPVGGALAAGAVTVGGPSIGIIDGGVASHSSFLRATIEQQGFAGPPKATGHGTAVASLIVGRDGAFRGAAPGASLLVADVYGGNRAAGSASTIVRALGWLARKRPKVINVSLVGPPNNLVARAIQAVRARGIQVVAAVGNDGPAAPPQYPASYPGVIGVTGVDHRGRALIEANRALDLDFAAPGADMAAALPGQGYARVRGTSFAAPLVTSRLAVAGSPQLLIREARPGKGKVGRGVVCGTCRVEPKVVGAK